MTIKPEDSINYDGLCDILIYTSLLGVPIKDWLSSRYTLSI